MADGFDGALPTRAGATHALPKQLNVRIRAWIAQQPQPKPTRAEAIITLIEVGLDAAMGIKPAVPGEDVATFYEREARRAAANRFMIQGRQALRRSAAPKEHKPTRPQTEAEIAAGQAARAKLRKTVSMPEAPPSKRQVAADRAKEIAVGAVKQALANVDLPRKEKIERIPPALRTSKTVGPR